jgi:TRAP transporter TAXI family solute receptor
MIFRRAAWTALIGFVLTAAFVIGSAELGAQTVPSRISFQILTGSTGGSYFPLGQLIAGLISHPPGVDRCAAAGTCGPAGLVISARTSDGAVANVLAVNAGQADSGFAQQDVIAAAVAGTDPFRKAGKQANIRILAQLFSEDVHLLVAAKSTIKTVADLRGKRVSLGADSSGTSVTARAILSAYGIPVRRIKASHNASDVDAQLLQKGEIDAFFFVGGEPVTLVDDLLARGVARLVPIDGAGRARLLKSEPMLGADVIRAGTYRNTGAVATVSVPAYWIVNASVPENVVYGIAKALFSAGNRAALRDNPLSTTIRISDTTAKLPAPLHPGAAHYFHDAGVLH